MTQDDEGEDGDAGLTDAMPVAPPVEPFLGEPIALPIGTALGDYVIDGELGRGGMGIVYSATHSVIGKRAAIKVLRASGNPASVERFVQEARAVNQIGHPNIVDIFDFAQLTDGRRYLVMDLLTGESLRARIKRGPLPATEACFVIDEIASALIAAHGKGFVHRDLKPDNVFLSQHGASLYVKLLDFGLAKLLPSSGLPDGRAFRTATGVQLGTPDYMAPEQLRADPDIDHRADIFALGVLAFELLTGRRPARTTIDHEGLAGAPAEVLNAVPGIPSELAELVETMLASVREHRPSLVAVRAVLKRVRLQLPSVSSTALPALAASGESGETAAAPSQPPTESARPRPQSYPPEYSRSRSPSQPPREPSQTRLGIGAAVPRRLPAAPVPAPRRGSALWWLVGIAGLAAVAVALVLALT